MKATDSTLWTVVPLGYFKNHLDLFLPRRYCSKCFRDNAEAAQSRRDLHQKVNSRLDRWSLSHDGSSSDEEISFCKGPGTPCYFWSDRHAWDEVTDQLHWWGNAFCPLSGYYSPDSEEVICDYTGMRVSEAKRFMDERFASQGINVSQMSREEFMEKTLPVSFVQLRRAGITIQYSRAKHYDSSFYTSWLRNLQVALSSWDGATVPDLLSDAFQHHPHMESASRAILRHACAVSVDHRPEEFRGNSRFERDYTRKMLQDEIDFMEADLMAYDFSTDYEQYENNFYGRPMHEMMNEHMEYVRRPSKHSGSSGVGSGAGVCVVCSTVKRPTELVDGTCYLTASIICLRCAFPPCEKCGDKAWAWKLLKAGFELQHNMGLGKKRKQPPYGAWPLLEAEWSCRDLQGKPTIRHADPEGYQVPDETSGRLLRQLCLQGVSWQRFRKNGLQEHVSPASEMLCPVCKSERSCRRCEKPLREKDFDKDPKGELYKVCRACQHPTCSNCGATRGSIWTPNPKVEEPVPLCDDCESKHTCADCGKLLDADYFVVEEFQYE